MVAFCTECYVGKEGFIYELRWIPRKFGMTWLVKRGILAGVSRRLGFRPRVEVALNKTT